MTEKLEIINCSDYREGPFVVKNLRNGVRDYQIVDNTSTLMDKIINYSTNIIYRVDKFCERLGGVDKK